jgi:IclR family pca regulon transcriptional regulator
MARLKGVAMGRVGSLSPSKWQDQTAALEAPIGRAVRKPAEEIAALGGDPNFMTSLARGLAVIQAFSEPRQRLTISHLSSRPRPDCRVQLYAAAFTR